MRLSFIGMDFPFVRRRASSSAHFKPVSASPESQWRRPTPAWNPPSSAVGFPPFARMRIPNRSSPTMTGSTALSGSCRQSHSTTRERARVWWAHSNCRRQTRYFTAHPLIYSRWAPRSPSAGGQPLDHALVRRSGTTGEGDSPLDRDAPHRMPAPVPFGPYARILPARRSGLWRRWWSSPWISISYTGVKPDRRQRGLIELRLFH
jgi:hypothetical protein